MSNQRGEFEFWAQSHHGIYSIGSVDGVYSNQLVMNDWFVWQAAIASIVVELPKNGQPVFLNDYAEGVVAGADIYRTAVEQALSNAGIKWK